MFTPFSLKNIVLKLYKSLTIRIRNFMWSTEVKCVPDVGFKPSALGAAVA